MSEIVEALRAKARQRRPNRQQDRAAFYLTGRTAHTQLGDVANLGLRAAPLAAYRRLEELRHDFPVILVDDPVRPVIALSALVDDLVDDLIEQSGDETAEQARPAALALEGTLRRAAEAGVSRLSASWSAAVAALTAQDAVWEPALAQLTAARGRRGVDGELVACTTDSPRRIVIHAWTVVQAARVQRLATHGPAAPGAGRHPGRRAGQLPRRPDPGPARAVDRGGIRRRPGRRGAVPVADREPARVRAVRTPGVPGFAGC
ncbi:MAG: hypothetical protein U0Q19_17520 [Kineosporiaceae bacterium]